MFVVDFVVVDVVVVLFDCLFVFCCFFFAVMPFALKIVKVRFYHQQITFFQNTEIKPIRMSGATIR